jgi:cytochrome c-type biogenesis protein CcmE
VTALRPKHQRLILAGLAVAALLAAVLLAMWGLRDRAAYFYTPSELSASKAPPGKAIRVGGMVKRGSIAPASADGLSITFVVADEEDEVPVVYRGITPDLFKEGSGVVAEGKLLPQGLFVADTILAKHDERYMPPELGNQAAEHAAGKTLKR